MPGTTFREAALRGLAFLIECHGFRVVTDDECFVRLESSTLGAEAMLDPRGEFELAIFRLGHEAPVERWTDTGLVGRAAAERLVEIAAERLRAEEGVLRADPDFFAHLAETKRRESEEWTAYYAGTGPRPQTGELP